MNEAQNVDKRVTDVLLMENKHMSLLQVMWWAASQGDNICYVIIYLPPFKLCLRVSKLWLYRKVSPQPSNCFSPGVQWCQITNPFVMNERGKKKTGFTRGRWSITMMQPRFIVTLKPLSFKPLNTDKILFRKCKQSYLFLFGASQPVCL